MTTTKHELTNKLRGIHSGAAILLHRELIDELGEDAANALWGQACDALTFEREEHSDGPVHTFFSFSYSSYQVVPRVLAQSMPHEWQARFVQCMEEMQAAFGYLGDVSYDVRTAEEEYACDLSVSQREATGVTSEWDDERNAMVYHDRNGNEIDQWTRVMVPVPDPLPPYSRGRTRVPRADQLAQTGGKS